MERGLVLLWRMTQSLIILHPNPLNN